MDGISETGTVSIGSAVPVDHRHTFVLKFIDHDQSPLADYIIRAGCACGYFYFSMDYCPEHKRQAVWNEVRHFNSQRPAEIKRMDEVKPLPMIKEKPKKEEVKKVEPKPQGINFMELDKGTQQTVAAALQKQLDKGTQQTVAAALQKQKKPSQHDHQVDQQRHERQIFIHAHKEEVIKDLRTIGRQATEVKWDLPHRSMGQFMSKWGIAPALSAQAKVVPEKPAPGVDGFPKWNEAWATEVKVKWLEVYAQLSYQRTIPEIPEAK